MWLLSFTTILCCVQFGVESRTLRWAPDADASRKENYAGGRGICSGRSLVFPGTMDAVVQMGEGITSTRDVVLPLDGDLLLAEDGALTLGSSSSDIDSTRDCDHGEAVFTGGEAAEWGQAGVWTSRSFTPATPDSERIPCYDDLISFSDTAHFAVILPEQEQTVFQVNLGAFPVDATQLNDVTQQLGGYGMFVLNSLEQTGLKTSNEKCYSKAGCPCQVTPPPLKCIPGRCHSSRCSNPIQPQGNCCPICGAELIYHIDSQKFNWIKFRWEVDSTLRHAADGISWHVGKPRDGTVQILIVDNPGWDGEAEDTLPRLRRSLSMVDGAKEIIVELSVGNKLGSAVKSVIGTLLGVLAVLSILYLRYYGSWPPSLSRFSHLSPLSRRSESALTLTRRDSCEPTAAFRNPLYETSGGRVSVVENEESPDD